MKTIIATKYKTISDSYALDHEASLLYCPFCSSFDIDNLMLSDYVVKPMLWCGNCNARAILDLNDVYSGYANDTDVDIYQYESMNIEHLEVIGDMDKLKIKHPEINYKALNSLLDENKDNDDDNDNDNNDNNEYTYYYVELLYIEKVINYELANYYSEKLQTQESIRHFIKKNTTITLRSHYR